MGRKLQSGVVFILIKEYRYSGGMNYPDSKPANYPAISLTILRLCSAVTSSVVYVGDKTDMALSALTPWEAVFYTHMFTNRWDCVN